MITTLLFVVHI